MIAGPAPARDVVALAPRLGVLALLRFGLAIIPLAARATVPDVVDVGWSPLAHVCAGYLLIAVGLEALRQLLDRPLRPLVSLGLLLDGAFVGTVLALTGGPQSPLLFLAFAHVAAATLLVSHRTGLKVALWHSLLLVMGHSVRHVDGSAGAPGLQAAAFAVCAYWIVALVTARCSALNERDLRRSRAGFQTLTQMATRLGDAVSHDEVLRILLASVAGYFPGRRFAVFVADHGRRHLSVSVDGARHDVEVDRRPPLDAVIRRSWAERSAVLVRALDSADDPSLTAALPAARNLVVVPLLVDGEPVGAVVAERGGRLGLRVPAGTVAMLGQFAAYAGLAYRNIGLLAEVRRLATVDELTQLANRRTFESELAAQVERSVRSGEPLSLMLLDIDHFKAVNDEHGHQLGDEVLRHVGHALREGRRAYDIAARYGGEEFAVIMPGADSEAAFAVADRLRRALNEEAPLPITASAGVATLQGAAADTEDLIRAADAALYDAKAAGRDRTLVAPPVGVVMLRPLAS